MSKWHFGNEVATFAAVIRVNAALVNPVGGDWKVTGDVLRHPVVQIVVSILRIGSYSVIFQLKCGMVPMFTISDKT